MQIDNAKDSDAVMNMNNLIEYNENYLQTSGSYGNTKVRSSSFK